MPRVTFGQPAPPAPTPSAAPTRAAPPPAKSVLGAAVEGFVEGLHDTFVRGNNPFNRAYQAEAAHLDRAAELFGAQGDTPLEAGAKLAGVLVSDATGATDLYEAGSGRDTARFVETGDDHRLTNGERALRGVTGTLKLVGAGAQGASVVSGTRALAAEARALATAARGAAAQGSSGVLTGHGAVARGVVRLPDNVSVNVYSRSGQPLANDVGRVLDAGTGGAKLVGTFRGGSTMPEHILAPIDDAMVAAPTGGRLMVRVTEPTRLSELASQVSQASGGKPVVLDWSACRSTAPGWAAEAATEVGAANVTSQAGRFLGTLGQPSDPTTPR